MMMRAYHRWFGLAGAVFMIFLAITGIALQVELWVSGAPTPGSDQKPPAGEVRLPERAALENMVSDAIDKARTTAPDIEIKQLEVVFTPGGPLLKAGGPGPVAPHVAYNPQTGEARKVVPSPGWHHFLQDLHAGYLFGIGGRLLSLFAGIALLALGVTGLYIYSDLYSRRRKAGRKAMFWKK